MAAWKYLQLLNDNFGTTYTRIVQIAQLLMITWKFPQFVTFYAFNHPNASSLKTALTKLYHPPSPLQFEVTNLNDHMLKEFTNILLTSTGTSQKRTKDQTSNEYVHSPTAKMCSQSCGISQSQPTTYLYQ